MGAYRRISGTMGVDMIMEHEKSEQKVMRRSRTDRVVFNVNGIKAEAGAQVNRKCTFFLIFILSQRMKFRRWFLFAIPMNPVFPGACRSMMQIWSAKAMQ